MSRFRRRLIFLCLVFAGWALLCAVQLIRFSVVERESLRRESGRIAEREGSIPALRGQIRDANGIPLAWTEIRRDAVLERWSVSAPVKQSLIRTLKREFSIEIPPDAVPPLVIRKNLSPSDMEKFAELMSIYSGLSVRTQIRRRQVEYPEIRGLLGECTSDPDGTLIGKSGLELLRDPELRGTPGRFRVMLDRRGQWIPQTLRIDPEGTPGHDVRLDQTLAELRRAAGK